VTFGEVALSPVLSLQAQRIEQLALPPAIRLEIVTAVVAEQGAVIV
jgi:hypothetical protein